MILINWPTSSLPKEKEMRALVQFVVQMKVKKKEKTLVNQRLQRYYCCYCGAYYLELWREC
jgi:hypothetical protein